MKRENEIIFTIIQNKAINITLEPVSITGNINVRIYGNADSDILIVNGKRYPRKDGVYIVPASEIKAANGIMNILRTENDVENLPKLEFVNFGRDSFLLPQLASESIKKMLEALCEIQETNKIYIEKIKELEQAVAYLNDFKLGVNVSIKKAEESINKIETRHLRLKESAEKLFNEQSNKISALETEIERLKNKII